MPVVDFDSLDQVLRDPGTFAGKPITAGSDLQQVVVSTLVPDSEWSADVEDLYVSVQVSSDGGTTWKHIAGFGAGKGIPAGVPSAILPGKALRSKRIRAVLTTRKKMVVGVRIDTI